MPRYIQATDEEVERAGAIEACFEPAPGVKRRAGGRAPRGATDLEIVFETPKATQAALSIRLDGEPIVLTRNLARAPQHRFAASVAKSREAELTVRTRIDGRASTMTTTIRLTGGKHNLLVHHWAAGAPPRVSLDGVQINRGPGLHLRQVKELPPVDDRRRTAFLIQDGRGLLDRAEPVRIYIDDELVAKHDAFVVDFVVRAVHRATLTMGLHRIVVVSHRRGWVLADTDVVINGVNEPRLVWRRPNLDSAEFTQLAGVAVRFTGRHDRTGFRETAARLTIEFERIEIDGVEIPDGIDNYEERIRQAKRFSEAMIANYRAFLGAKRAVEEKKKAGEELTDDDKKIDAIDSYEKMQDWVKAKKKAEGFDIQEAGKTDGGGDSRSTLPPPENPFDELMEKMTLEVHEPSHVEQNRKRAEDVGLDWEKLQRFLRVLKKFFELTDSGKSDEEAMAELTPEEIDLLSWARANKDKLDEYKRRREDPVAGAESEIQEYEAEVKFLEEVLQMLQDKKDLGKQGAVPEEYLSRIVHYFYGIREIFDEFSEEEKEEMRRQLRALRAQVRGSDKLSDEEKARLIDRINRTLDALDQ